MADDKKIIFSMVNVSKTIPSQRQILKNIYLSFFYGAKIGVLGLNGAGKSTLLKIIAGLDKSYQGEVVFAPGYSIGYLPQEPQLDDTLTVKEVVQQGVQKIVDVLKEYEEVNMKFAEPMSDDEMNKLIERQGELTELIDQYDAWELDSKLERAMDALRCPDGDTPVKHLSGGERRRVALCRLLLTEPDILLLDEPTNHLDAESVEWLEAHLQQYKGTVIAVTHDRYFLDHVAGWILELDRGEGIPWQGNYSSWLEQKSNRLAMEQKQESKRMKTLRRCRSLYPTDRVWAMSSSRPSTCARPSATNCSSRISTSTCRPTASWASSGPTAPAKPPSSASLWAWSSPTVATSR